MIHTPHVVLRLLPHILQKLLINRVKRIAKLELTPKQNPTLVSKIKQEVRTIRSRGLRGKPVRVSKNLQSCPERKSSNTHPNPQHILIPIHHTIKEPFHLLDRDSRPESVRRMKFEPLA